MSAIKTTYTSTLRPEVTCPHCWHHFAPEELLWIASHPDLVDDPVAGSDAKLRFLPTLFDLAGNAIDSKGDVCREFACPVCHLAICRSLLEIEPLFVSILGAPSSGKSYFLASMIHQLESTLLRMQMSLDNSDPASNQKLSDYIETLFRTGDEDQWVTLRKTETEGDLYDAVTLGGRPVRYPRPFVFSVQPNNQHPGFEQRSKISRALCLYDNAGEHFLPGIGTTSDAPVTQHLGLSKALLFLFDPTQEPDFRAACRGKSEDPQMLKHGANHRQDLILAEAARRIRDQTGLPSTQLYDKPLVVVVTKYDAWSGLTKHERLSSNLVLKQLAEGNIALNSNTIQQLSDQVRSLLLKHAGKVVAVAEGFASDVTYIPVSSIGCNPKVINGTDGKDHLLVRTGDIRPMWAEVPLLYVLYRTIKGLVPRYASASKEARPTDSGMQPNDAASPAHPIQSQPLRETGT